MKLYSIIFHYIELCDIIIYIYTLNIIMLYYNIYNYLYIIQQILYIHLLEVQLAVVRRHFFQPQKKWHQSSLRIESADQSRLWQTQVDEFWYLFRLRITWLGGRVVTTLSLSLSSLCSTLYPVNPVLIHICQSTSQDRYAKTNRLHHITICLKDWDVILCKSLYNMCT